MPDNDIPDTSAPTYGLRVTMPAQLLQHVDTLRSAVQESIGPGEVVSRADVVRLALYRLYLAYLARCSEVDPISPKTQLAWDATVASLREDCPCPSWLMPGADPEGSKPKKKGR